MFFSPQNDPVQLALLRAGAPAGLALLQDPGGAGAHPPEGVRAVMGLGALGQETLTHASMLFYHLDVEDTITWSINTL